MITFIIIIIIALIVFLFCYFYQLYQHEYDKFILQNSLCLKQLKEINNRYKCHTKISLTSSAQKQLRIPPNLFRFSSTDGSFSVLKLLNNIRKLQLFRLFQSVFSNHF